MTKVAVIRQHDCWNIAVEFPNSNKIQNLFNLI